MKEGWLTKQRGTGQDVEEALVRVEGTNTSLTTSTPTKSRWPHFSLHSQLCFSCTQLDQEGNEEESSARQRSGWEDQTPDGEGDKFGQGQFFSNRESKSMMKLID